MTISLLSGFGGSAMSLVTGVWILDLTGSPGRAGLAGLCVYAPTLAGPWLGAITDRIPRRPLLVATNLVLAAALLSLFAVHSAQQAWLIYLVSFTYGISYVVLDAGESALLPAALAPQHLGTVNGWRSAAREGMKLLSPLAGAGLYAWQGGSAVAALSALMPMIVALLYPLLGLTGSATPAAVERGFRAGLAVLRARPVLRVTVPLAGVSIALSGFSTAPGYAVVTEDMHLPSTFLGLLMSAQGAGSIVAGLTAGRVVSRHGAIAAGAAGTALFAAGLLARCLPWWPAIVAGAVVAGAGLPWTLVAAVTAVQTHTPAHLLGRVSATANTAMFGPIALANPLGSAAVHLGGRPSLIAAAVACLAAAAVATRLRPGTSG
ncbi:MFS transporter [Couchioplanes azureus]|uniref:MFS transporter n=1 Tax=Couchioplanes caeruleus TaxID=56438 RepID=UPI001E545264|nr:MFS transporter [Couchioplanes caeruleus]